MKTKFLLSLACVAFLSLVQGEQYTDRYDNVNVEEILGNRRLLVPYVKCLLDQGRCTAEGKELKLHVKEAMQTACEKCTRSQRQGARRVVNHIKTNEREYWEQMQKKYDPKGEYRDIYEKFLAASD